MLHNHQDLTLSYVEAIPSGKSGSLPLVITLHGRGADAHDLADLAPAIDGSGYRFLFPNAPMPWEFMPGYSQGYTWFEGWPPEGDSFDTSSRMLLKFIEEVRERYQTPWSQIVLTGFSQGAMMSLDAAWRLPEKIAGVVAMSGAVNEQQMPDFGRFVDLPVLVVHGAIDDVIPVGAARRARLLLESAGLKVEYGEFEIGHWVTQESVAQVAAFVKRLLG